MKDALDSFRSTEALKTIVPAVFADMTFIDVEVSSPAGADPEGRAAIDILKPVSCRLELAVGPELRSRIADILFGESEERGRDDAFLELLNIAAGAFISEYFGVGADAKLELPHYLYLDDGSEGPEVAAVTFDAEGEPVQATLRSVRYRY